MKSGYWFVAKENMVGMTALDRKDCKVPLAINTDDFIESYVAEGEKKALELDNRSPIVFNDDGTLDSKILDAFWKYGFYVLEGVLIEEELNDLQTELEDVFERAPKDEGSDVDVQGRKAIGADFKRRTFRFTNPLSDPNGETDNANGRYEVKMSEPEPPTDAPKYVISNVSSHCFSKLSKHVNH